MSGRVRVRGRVDACGEHYVVVTADGMGFYARPGRWRAGDRVTVVTSPSRAVLWGVHATWWQRRRNAFSHWRSGS